MNVKIKNTEDYRDYFKFVIIVFIVVLFSRFFLFELVSVSGDSMYPTLEDGDRLILSKVSYVLGDVKKNDVIVFNANDKDKYIKRVVGISGDSIYMKNDTLYINNKKINEYYLDDVYMKDKIKKDNLIHFTDDFDLEFLKDNHKVVPDGYIFVLGDNRPNSNDSRNIGVIKEKDIIGKIVFKKF